jgi:transcriptional regulator with XRE-family HTH domain
MDRIRALREERGWSQADLADRAGVTRQLVGAVEAGRHTPSVRAALGLARALGVSVEALFAESADPVVVPVTGRPLAPGTPLVTARVGEAVVGVPLAHALPPGEAWAMADAVAGETGVEWLPAAATDGLIVAGCDPLLGLVARVVARASSDRILTVHTSTDRAVAALASGRVHGVVVHGPVGDLPTPPVAVRRWHVAHWRVGLASAGSTRAPSVEEIAERRLRVVQRDPGAGSQRAFERALVAVGASTPVPGPVAQGHLDVARRVAERAGRAGVTMEAAARAYGLGFTPLEVHQVELWIDDRWAELPEARSLVEQLGRPELARRVAILGGYDLAGCGTEQPDAPPAPNRAVQA